MNISDFSNLLASVDVMNEAKEAIFANDAEILALQRRQFDDGKKPDGSSFVGIEFYVGGREFHYDELLWTGDLRNGLLIEDNTAIWSSGDKGQNENIEGLYGLTDENIEFVKTRIRQIFIESIKEKI